MMNIYAKNVTNKAGLIVVLLLLVACQLAGSGDRVYIDPQNTNSSSRNGTIDNPYASWKEVDITSNTSYFIKRSTELPLYQTLNIYRKSGVTIDAYGEGEPPVIQAGAIEKAVDIYNSQGIKIKNINLTGNSNNVFGFRIRGDSREIKIERCQTSDFLWGIRLMGHSQKDPLENITITNSLIERIADDGVFARHVSGLLIDSCQIRRVNQNWFRVGKAESQSAGDGIQLDRCTNYKISNSNIDRTDTGNKFCIIANKSKNGQITNNILKGPTNEGHGGAAVYLGYGSDSVKITNNVISGSPCGIYSHSKNSFVYRNIIKENSVGAWFIDINKGIVLNNTFFNNSVALKGSNLEVYNNIFYAEAHTGSLISFSGTSVTDYNCYFTSTPKRIFNHYGGLEAYSIRTGNGKNSVFEDPLFENEAGENFSLKEKSVCLDRGLNKKYSWDVIYKHCGEAVDIGAKERCSYEE